MAAAPPGYDDHRDDHGAARRRAQDAGEHPVLVCVCACVIRVRLRVCVCM